MISVRNASDVSQNLPVAESDVIKVLSPWVLMAMVRQCEWMAAKLTKGHQTLEVLMTLQGKLGLIYQDSESFTHFQCYRYVVRIKIKFQHVTSFPVQFINCESEDTQVQ